MSTSTLSALQERFASALTMGDRPAARTVIAECISANWDGRRLIDDLLWPVSQNIQIQHRADQLSTLSFQFATRLLRVLVDQASARIQFGPSRNRRILAISGPGDADEMTAQMAVDTLEAAGFSVTFAGGGIANDEITAFLHQHRPDILVLFASAPSDLPNIRQLIDSLREIQACPNLQIAVGAGVFNRADGLAEEIGADLWATSPAELAEMLIDEPARRAGTGQRTVGKSKRSRKAA
ncbi:MAG: B12-binding domain-containing protein [bacterium]|nr:cobalamin-dependent protein [Phycisphaerales bacterium]MCE2653012.1 hypothetical protein [Planctomycetaceae bacterium]